MKPIKPIVLNLTLLLSTLAVCFGANNSSAQECQDCAGMSPFKVYQRLFDIHLNDKKSRNLRIEEFDQFNRPVPVVCSNGGRIFHSKLSATTYQDDSAGPLFRTRSVYASLHTWYSGNEYWWDNAAPEYSRPMSKHSSKYADEQLRDLQAGSVPMFKKYSCNPDQGWGFEVINHSWAMSVPGRDLSRPSRALNEYRYYFKYNPSVSGGLYTVALDYTIHNPSKNDPDGSFNFLAFCYIDMK